MSPAAPDPSSGPEPDRESVRPRGIRRPFSGVRPRLFAYAVLILLLGIGMTVFTVRQILIRQMDSRIDQQMTQEIQEFRSLAGGDDPADGRPFAGRLGPLFTTFLERNVLSRSELIFTFVDGRPFRLKAPPGSDGTDPPELLSPSLIARLSRPEASLRGTTQTPAGELRYIAVPVRANDELRGSFVVANLIDTDRAELDDAIKVAVLVGLVALLTGSLVAFLAAGRVLRPLRELTETARSIEESDLGGRITVTGHDELAELGLTFNAMLDRLEGAFSSQRELIRSVNHELRTPITIVRGHLELIEDDPAERRATIELVTDELDRMSILVDDLLTLARSERDDFLERETVEVYPLLDDLLTKATTLGSRTWRLDVAEDPGAVSIDRQRMNQALLNLIDNAVRQTDDGQTIALGAARSDGTVSFWVDDEGPGIAPGDADRIFERFERGRLGRRYPGSGLGLAIVSVIAEAHGGSIEAGASPLGGARFTLTIPSDPSGRPAAPEGRGDDSITKGASR